MKLVTYTVKKTELTISGDEPAGARIGWVQDGHIVDVGFAQEWATLNKGLPITRVLPTDMLAFLESGEEGMEILFRVTDVLKGENPASLEVEGEPVAIPLDAAELAAPLPGPRSFRDFYAFEQHVKTARARRGLEMVPEWYEIPVFYFSNPHSIVGPDAPVEKPPNTGELDYELEVAFVIGKGGRDIPAERALDHVAGFSVLNDWSARDLQRKEMKVGLGPAKGKDFATSVGPWLVTLDELEDRRQGDRFDLTMTARVNGRELSRGNVGDLTHSFARMIEQASKNCTLLPGDLIGSGTVGTGCILELGTEVHRWLEPGDVVELEIEKLGVLKNRVIPPGEGREHP
ncbi:fumarylacetoacetate (FAA) hydrolase [Melghirimyces profundicolus]|uniref:Fumarylacetoacetate (FAA) hydrolase n=1 Tax=Melghirimyces profundicolus TaxID=1242148 RepID=A0A2T6BC46_9BACL|nr:fumarylacetoacetate hydrolase family protein [Melghirimyces profundicolus]PTX53661.1 fumarylacetoacetate (FAA) hydrolase [Melghirimyces profundicolus]